jgi:predicted ArsR family transcriptional regulator
MIDNASYTLFPSGSASREVQETSIAALESLAPETKAKREQQILAYIKNNGGATCCEIEVALGLLHQSASSTMTKLRKGGHIVDTRERRPTNTGRMAIVWGVAQ